MMNFDLKRLFERQQDFNKIFYESDLSIEEKEEITKSLSLALHSEISDLISGINFKDHRNIKKEVDLNKITYESVDAFRYLLAILNLWDISSETFINAFEDKDLFLHARHKSTQNKWNGQPVIIFGLDDVISEFRSGFIDWLDEKYSIKADKNSSEYYTTTEVKRAGHNPEEVFLRFIESRGLRGLSANNKVIKLINSLVAEGFWIQILTARPDENPICRYDTYFWLEKLQVNYHRLDFSAEKYRWLTQSEYFDSGSVVCAVDDSPKHAGEYAKHGVPVLLPKLSYNSEVWSVENIHVYDNPENLNDIIKTLI